MAGQGYHYGLAKLIAAELDRDFSVEMRMGVLAVDAFNAAAGSRRNSHFTGGAGAVFPHYNELRQVSKFQSWDSGYIKSYLVDPKIDMRLFEAVNIHIGESDYKDGIRIHLIGDKLYDHLVQQVLFNLRYQKDGIVIDRSTGIEMDGPSFRKELYASYPLLDQYLLNLASVTAEEMQETRDLVTATFNEEMAAFLLKYLNFNPELEWSDTEFFKKDVVDKLIDDIKVKSKHYLSK